MSGGSDNSPDVAFSATTVADAVIEAKGGEISGVPINFRDAECMGKDPANQAVAGRLASKTVRMGLAQFFCDAAFIGDEILKREAYPLSSISLVVDRSAFALEPGDNFRLTYSPYGITGKVFRVISIEESAPDSEEIRIQAEENVTYIGKSMGLMTQAFSDQPKKDAELSLEALDVIKLVEMPYALVGEAMRSYITLGVLAGKKAGNERGVLTFFSSDGSGYRRVSDQGAYCLSGLLASAYSGDTYQVDDDSSFTVDIDSANAAIEAASLQTVTRSELFSNVNMALIDDEVVSWQTITPVTSTRHQFSGVVRGLFDTVKANHASSARVFFLTANPPRVSSLDVPGLAVDGAAWKVVPYNARYAGSLAAATAQEIDVTGRIYKPYPPVNLAANGSTVLARYTSDIVLTWSPRLRAARTSTRIDVPFVTLMGAGLDPAVDVVTDVDVDYYESFEGSFMVMMYAGGDLIYSSACSAAAHTITEAQILSACGCLPKEVLIKIKNSVFGDYYSDAAEIVVKNFAGCDLGSATTTTTTTTTTEE